MLRKSITRKITTSIIDEKRVESFNLLIKAKQKEKKSIKYLFHNQESMSIILYILSKNKRTSRDIYILNSFLKTQKQFMQIVQEEEESLDKEEILTKLASEKSADDTTLKTKAMVNLRNKYGLTINDSELKNYYDRYINRQLNQTTTKK